MYCSFLQFRTGRLDYGFVIYYPTSGLKCNVLLKRCDIRRTEGERIIHAPTYFMGIRSEVFLPLGHRGASRYIEGIDGPCSVGTSASAFC